MKVLSPDCGIAKKDVRQLQHVEKLCSESQRYRILSSHEDTHDRKHERSSAIRESQCSTGSKALHVGSSSLIHVHAISHTELHDRPLNSTRFNLELLKSTTTNQHHSNIRGGTYVLFRRDSRQPGAGGNSRPPRKEETNAPPPLIEGRLRHSREIHVRQDSLPPNVEKRDIGLQRAWRQCPTVMAVPHAQVSKECIISTASW